MKLLYDLLRRQMRDTPVLALLQDATVFFNSDALERAVNGEVELELLPSLAPPYEKFFIECPFPMLDNLKQMGVVATPRIGAMITALEADEMIMGKWHDAVAAEPRWSYEVILFLENVNTGYVSTVGAANVLLDAEGQAIAFTKNGQEGYCYFMMQPDFHDDVVKRGADQDGYFVLAQTIVDAALYTVGMLHCRNIGTDVIEPSRAESHKFEKRYGFPMTRYHVLKVTGKGSAAGEQIGAPTGEKRPLHWARGHFKTYTDSAPLMGQHVGTWYWGAQVRGHANEGMVTKDYEIAMKGEER